MKLGKEDLIELLSKGLTEMELDPEGNALKLRFAPPAPELSSLTFGEQQTPPKKTPFEHALSNVMGQGARGVES